MTIDTFTGFTDYYWSGDHRPELRIVKSGLGHPVATLTIGRDALAPPAIELEGTLDEVLCELEGYAEIFQAAVAYLRREKLKKESAMIVNLNVRVLGNDAVFVQYQKDGKAKDAAFINWPEFIEWLAAEVVAPIA